MIRRNRTSAASTDRARRIRNSAACEDASEPRGSIRTPSPAAVADAPGAPARPWPAVAADPPSAILGLAVLLLLIVATVGGILLWQRVAAFNDSVSDAPATSSALCGPLDGDEPVNIALFGYGGAEHKSGNYLADSIQILSIDPSTNTTTMIPIPRDLWVEGLSQLPDNGKINEAFAIGWQQGGVERAAGKTAEVLAKVTGLQIDHWMAIDFAGFQAMVDAVGGVDVENPRAFRYTWNEGKFEHSNWDGRFAKGRSTWTARRRWTTPERATRASRRSRATSPDPSASSGCWVRCAPSWGRRHRLARPGPGDDGCAGRADDDRPVGHRPVPAERPPAARIGASS